MYRPFELGLPPLCGEGREAARELLFAAREAWEDGCQDMCGTPEELEEQLYRGRYILRRFTSRTLRMGCRLLAEKVPHLLVAVRPGEYVIPFEALRQA